MTFKSRNQVGGSLLGLSTIAYVMQLVSLTKISKIQQKSCARPGQRTFSPEHIISRYELQRFSDGEIFS